MLIDLLVIAGYVGGVVVFGAAITRKYRDIRGYFLSEQPIPWWAISASIVATETSTATFISVPGFAFANDFTFLQLAFGYVIGRIVVAALFVPAYFRGELLTVYQLLGERFGGATKRLTSALFLITRSLADGLRLFATGLVLAAMFSGNAVVESSLQAWAPGWSPTATILVVSVLVVGLATIVYTYLGGMTAVIWTDVVQLAVYMAGAVVAAAVLIDTIPGGLPAAVSTGSADGKFRLFDFAFDVTRSYTFWSGVIGGAFLTMATHGTDQLIVQRYMCSRSVGQARLAVTVSGVVVLVQFALFLFLGTLLYVYYQAAPEELHALTTNGRVATDRLFPAFIVGHLPSGLRGLVIAAVFAAAMSTLSSSLNSSAAATVNDFYVPATRRRRSREHYLSVARVTTAAWGAVQIAVAVAAISISTRVVDEVLGIAAFTNGVVLGVFLLGTLTAVGQRSALAGVAVGAAGMLAVKMYTAVSWQWYVLIGAALTCAVAVAADHARRRGRARS